MDVSTALMGMVVVLGVGFLAGCAWACILRDDSDNPGGGD